MCKILTLVLVIFLGACQKEDLSQVVAFYSIRQFDMEGTYIIDEASVKLGNEILIAYDDLIAYDSRNHSFVISEVAAKE